MIPLKLIQIGFRKDNREENKQKDLNGDFIKYKQCEYPIVIEFENNNIYTPTFEELGILIYCLTHFFAISEDYRFPNSILKRNMFFLSYIYPLYKEYLESYGLKIPKEHLDLISTFKEKTNGTK